MNDEVGIFHALKYPIIPDILNNGDFLSLQFMVKCFVMQFCEIVYGSYDRDSWPSEICLVIGHLDTKGFLEYFSSI